MGLRTQITRKGEGLNLRWGSFHVAAMIIASSIDSGKGPFDDNTLSGIFVPCGDGCTCTPREGEIMELDPRDYGPLFFGCMMGRLAGVVFADQPYVLQEGYIFRDLADGEILELLPGDTLAAWRS